MSTEPPRITVHHLNDSRSQRVLWLLEELEVPYEIKKYQREKTMQAPEELKKVHPLGKSPVITDGETVVAESGAIVEYLIQKYGVEKFTPKTDASKLSNLYWTHYSEGTLMPILVNAYIFILAPKHAPFFIRPLVSVIMNQMTAQIVEPRMRDNAKLIEDHLAKQSSGWFAGEEHPTGADFMMSFALEALSSRGSAVMGPMMKEYVARIHARPAYKRGLEKGGAYSYAKL